MAGRTALRKCYSPLGMCELLPWGLDSLPESREKPTEGAPRHGNHGGARSRPSGNPQPDQLCAWAPGERKVSKVGRAAREGWEGLQSRSGQRRGRGFTKGRTQPLAPCSGLVSAPRPAQAPLYDVPDAGGAQAAGPQQPGRTVSLRERLLLTRPVWLQLRANAAAALHVLRTEPPGVSASPSPGAWWLRVGREGLDREVLSPHPLSTRRPSWCGNLTLASAKPCACGCLKPVAPPSFPATASKKALGVRGNEWLGGKGLAASRAGHSGVGVGSPGNGPHFPSLRHLFGGLRAGVPGPGPAHLCLLPHPVSLPTGCLLSVGPCSLGHPVCPQALRRSQRPPDHSLEHSSLLTFCSPLWPQGHSSPPAPAPQSHPPGSHPQGTGSHLPSGRR